MLAVRSTELASGAPLAHALYTRGGRLLAHAGTVMTGEMLGLLDPQAGLVYDTRAEPLGIRGAAEAGPRALYDGAGSVVGSFSARGGLSVEELDLRNWERRLIRVRAELRRAAGPLVQVARSRWEQMPLAVTVGHDPVTPQRRQLIERSTRVPNELERALRQRRAAGVAAVRSVMSALLDGEHVGVDRVQEIVDDLLDAAARHPEVYSIPAVGLPRPVDSLPDHAFTTGAIAVGMAAHLGWPRADVRAAGLAGLLSDVGMGLVPYPVRQAGRALTEVELNAIRRHTEYAVAILRNVRGVSESVVMAVHQHHERCDGSGYPDGARADRLHDYSRIVAIAECFAGMTAPRAHRPALTPHAALSEIARMAAAGALDGTGVRALIDVLGLYPAGSFVKLSSGHVAVVGASAEPGASDRPTVHVVQPTGSPARFGRAIDLARIEPKVLRVVEAVGAPEGVLV